MSEYLTLKEVADLLRLKERQLYDLVKDGRIPSVKVTGKWLFPKAKLERWMAGGQATEPSPPAGPTPARAAAPGIIAGSRDPFLEWCIAQSGCGLAMSGGGSLAGIEAVVNGQAMAAGTHILDAGTGAYNVPAVAARVPADSGLVLIEWSRREAGLVVPRGNPLKLAALADLVAKRPRVAMRPDAAGAQVLLESLIAREGRTLADLAPAGIHATGFELGLAVLDGKADCGIATRAVARRLHLDFVPLVWERFDLLIGRFDYFEPPFQRLLAFARGADARAKAADLSGYDLDGFGTVWWNGR